MNNFERIKQTKNVYEMSDIVMGFIGNHIHAIKREDGSINPLIFLRWLESNKNIFDEERND